MSLCSAGHLQLPLRRRTQLRRSSHADASVDGPIRRSQQQPHWPVLNELGRPFDSLALVGRSGQARLSQSERLEAVHQAEQPKAAVPTLLGPVRLPHPRRFQ